MGSLTSAAFSPNSQVLLKGLSKVSEVLRSSGARWTQDETVTLDPLN
jgi:hypothetical protein